MLVGGTLGCESFGLGADGEVDGPSDEALIAEWWQVY